VGCAGCRKVALKVRKLAVLQHKRRADNIAVVYRRRRVLRPHRWPDCLPSSWDFWIGVPVPWDLSYQQMVRRYKENRKTLRLCCQRLVSTGRLQKVNELKEQEAPTGRRLVRIRMKRLTRQERRTRDEFWRWIVTNRLLKYWTSWSQDGGTGSKKTEKTSSGGEMVSEKAFGYLARVSRWDTSAQSLSGDCGSVYELRAACLPFCDPALCLAICTTSSRAGRQDELRRYSRGLWRL
jgi:hypothetical protein